MSIIYNTLNRLEMDHPELEDSPEKAWPPLPERKSMSLPVKVLATAMMLVFVGTGLMVWHLNDRLSDFDGLSLANAGDRTVDDGERPDRQLLPVPGRARTPAEAQPVVENGEKAATDRVAASAALSPAELTDAQPVTAGTGAPQAGPGEQPLVLASAEPARAETLPVTGDPRPEAKGEPIGVAPGEKTSVVAAAKPAAVEPRAAETAPAPAASVEARTTAAAVAPEPEPAAAAPEIAVTDGQKKGRSTRSKPVDKPMVAASVKPAKVKAPAAKPKAAPSAPPKQQVEAQVVAAGDTARPNDVDQAVERARVALSLGQYQQALEVLSSLSPAPEGRADFWLMKGSAHLALGQLDPAETAFASAQPLAPGNAQIAVQRAILKQEKGDHASALQILAEAASRHPSVPEIFLNLGYSQQELGAERDAGRSYRIFLRMTEGRSLYAEQRKTVELWLAQSRSTSG